MTRSTNMEHVEVLRDLSEVCRAAIKAGDWKVDGACDPDAALRRADAAIASLSAQQPPVEAQAVAWEWEYIGGDHYPRGHKVARSLREMDPTNPPYPETWRPTRPLIYGDTAPPSAPVGVEGLCRVYADAYHAGHHATVEGNYVDVLPVDRDTYWREKVEEDYPEARAQQPAAFRNDGNSEAEFIADDAVACTARGGSGHRDDQQPAAVAPVGVEVVRRVAENIRANLDSLPSIARVWADDLDQALAAQQGGGTDE